MDFSLLVIFCRLCKILKYRYVWQWKLAVQKNKNKKIDVKIFYEVEKTVKKTKMVNKKDVVSHYILGMLF